MHTRLHDPESANLEVFTDVTFYQVLSPNAHLVTCQAASVFPFGPGFHPEAHVACGYPPESARPPSLASLGPRPSSRVQDL